MANEQEESDVQGKRGGYKGGAQGTVTGSIIGSDEERPFRLVAPGDAAEPGTDELINRVLKEEYENISELVDAVLDMSKTNGSLIRKLTVEFGKKDKKPKKIVKSDKEKTGVRRGRPKKVEQSPTPVLNFGVGAGSVQDGETIAPEATGAVSGGGGTLPDNQGTPLFYTDSGENLYTEKTNRDLAREDKSGLFEDLDVSWFSLMLDAVNRLSERVDDIYTLLDNRVPTMDDLRGVVSGAVAGGEKQDTTVRADVKDKQEEEKKETPEESLGGDKNERDSKRSRRDRYREESWTEERLHELTGMAVNFAGLGELDDMLGITDMVWDKLGDLKDRFSDWRKNKKSRVDVLDPQEIMVPPKPAMDGEGEIIDVESVSDDVQKRLSGAGRHGLLELPPPVSWEFPDQKQLGNGTGPDGSLGSGSGAIGGDVIDIVGTSEELQLQPPPKESLEIVVPDDVKDALEGLKDAKIEKDDDLTKKDLLDVLKKQRVTRDIADMQQARFGEMVGSENNVLGGLGKDGVGDLKSLLKQMGSKKGGFGGMMSLLKAAPMLMLGKAAMVGATAAGGYMLGNEIFDQVAGDKYEARLMNDVDSNLTEKAKTDSGRDIAHTKGGYEESIRYLKLQNEELQQSGDPMALRLIEKNNKLIETYRGRADDLYSEGALKKALEGGKSFEDVASENRDVIARLEDELKNENVEDRRAKEEQLKYELLLKRGLDKKAEEIADVESEKAEEEAAQQKEETEAISDKVSEGVVEGAVSSGIPTIDSGVMLNQIAEGTTDKTEGLDTKKDVGGTLTGVGGTLTGAGLVTNGDVMGGKVDGLSAGASTIGLAAGGVGAGLLPVEGPRQSSKVYTASPVMPYSGEFQSAMYPSPFVGGVTDQVQSFGMGSTFGLHPYTSVDSVPAMNREVPFKELDGIPVGQYEQVEKSINGIPAGLYEQQAENKDGIPAVNREQIAKNIDGVQAGNRPIEAKNIDGIPALQMGVLGGHGLFGNLLQGQLGVSMPGLGAGIDGVISDIGGRTGISGLLQGGVSGNINDKFRGSIGGMLQGSKLVDITSGNFSVGGMLQGLDTGMLGDRVSGMISGGVSGRLSGGVREISQSLNSLNLIPDKISGAVQESVSRGEIQDGTSDIVRENEERNVEVLDKIAQSAMTAGSLAGTGSTVGGNDTGGGGRVSVSDARMGLDDVGIMLVNMGYFS